LKPEIPQLATSLEPAKTWGKGLRFYTREGVRREEKPFCNEWSKRKRGDLTTRGGVGKQEGRAHPRNNGARESMKAKGWCAR